MTGLGTFEEPSPYGDHAMTLKDTLIGHRKGEMEIYCTRCGSKVPADKVSCQECRVVVLETTDGTRRSDDSP